MTAVISDEDRSRPPRNDEPASEVALSFSLTEAEAPTYQRIARDVERLRALGLSLNKIAVHLGVDDKTIAKALRWNQSLAR